MVSVEEGSEPSVEEEGRLPPLAVLTEGVVEDRESETEEEKDVGVPVILNCWD